VTIARRVANQEPDGSQAQQQAQQQQQQQTSSSQQHPHQQPGRAQEEAGCPTRTELHPLCERYRCLLPYLPADAADFQQFSAQPYAVAAASKFRADASAQTALAVLCQMNSCCDSQCGKLFINGVLQPWEPASDEQLRQWLAKYSDVRISTRMGRDTLKQDIIAYLGSHDVEAKVKAVVATAQRMCLASARLDYERRAQERQQKQQPSATAAGSALPASMSLAALQYQLGAPGSTALPAPAVLPLSAADGRLPAITATVAASHHPLDAPASAASHATMRPPLGVAGGGLPPSAAATTWHLPLGMASSVAAPAASVVPLGVAGGGNPASAAAGQQLPALPGGTWQPTPGATCSTVADGAALPAFLFDPMLLEECSKVVGML
jgi:hypothetical protein